MVTVGLGGILLALFIGWVTLSVGGVVFRSAARLLPLVLLIAAAWLGSRALSGDNTREANITVAGIDWPASDTEHPVPGHDPLRKGWPMTDDLPADPFKMHTDPVHAVPATWMKVALGAVLIICGGLLATRRRPHSAAHKALTWVGVAATGLIVLAVFNPRERFSSHDPDRVVRSVSSVDAPAPVVTKVHKAKRPTRAKRPARPNAPEASPPELPARAGEIPVAAELARAAETAAAVPTSAPDAPAEAPKAAEVVAEKPPAEPSTAAEPKPAETKPAETQAVEPKAVEPKAAEPKAAEPKAAEPKPREASPADASATRPDWVEAPGKLVGSTYRISVKSGLYVDVPECQRALDEAIKQAADHYVEQYRGEGAAALVDIPRAYLREHVKRAEYGEIVTVSLGPMHQIHAMLEFDDEARAEFYNRWRDAVVKQRLWYTGSAAALVLALLGTFYSYLRLDLQTGGAHKGRLRLAATLVALIAAAGALLAQRAVPF